jgi:hypothetical protein
MSEKVEWMREWAEKNGMRLELAGECGFGRECVGVIVEGVEMYPDYEWRDEITYDRIDSNGDVWKPEHAYHKHPCVAVLGRGEQAESELYDWLKWFDDNGFVAESGLKDGSFSAIEAMLGKHLYARMVKK